MPRCEILVAANHCLVGRSLSVDFVDQVTRWAREGCANTASVGVYLNGFATEIVEQFHLCSEHDRLLRARVKQWLNEGAITDPIYNQ